MGYLENMEKMENTEMFSGSPTEMFSGSPTVFTLFIFKAFISSVEKIITSAHGERHWKAMKDAGEP